MKSLNFKNEKTKAFLESLLMILLGTIYILIGINFVPVISIVFPAFFIILGVRHGIEYNIVSILISTLVVGLVVDKYTAFFIFIAFVPLSVVINYVIKKRGKSQELILYSTITSLASYVIAIVLVKKLFNISFIDQIEKSFSLVLKTQLDMLKETGLSNYEVYQTKNILESAYEYMVLIIPSAVMIFSLLTAYLNSILSIFILRKLGYGIVFVPRFSYFKLPNNFILGIVVIYLGVFLLKQLKVFYYETIFINVSALISFAFFLQGLAVLIFLINKSRLKQVGKVIFIVLLIFSFPLSAIISMVGFLDIIFNFRGIKKEI